MVNMLAIVVIFARMEWFFSLLILVILFVYQVYELIRFVTRTNQELAKFMFAIRHSDYSISFSPKKLGSSFDELHGSFQEIIGSFRKARIEKEAQYQYFKLMVEHLSIGIISLNRKEEIVLMNQAAEKILESPNVKYWKRFTEKNPVFSRAVDSIGEGGSKLIELHIGHEIRHISVYVTSIMLIGERFKVITFQNIKTEIELKEIEAWHKLIRILTHEIMNSVTPIASLTETMGMLLEDEEGNQKGPGELDEETITDIRMALKTIDRRSNGLLHFVTDYRKLTKVPEPRLERFKISDLMERVKLLMQGETSRANVELRVIHKVKNLEMYADVKLLEQILINLVVNAIDAVHEKEDGFIQMSAYIDGNQKVIEISDNGSGIDPELLDKIFIPFFSTKEKGSGIGLSLSKHIMKMHEGTIRVQSKKDEGSSFFLVFP